MTGAQIMINTTFVHLIFLGGKGKGCGPLFEFEWEVGGGGGERWLGAYLLFLPSGWALIGGGRLFE